MTKQEVKNLLQVLGFEPDMLKSVWSKDYPLCNKVLSVDIDNERINYDKIGIELGDTTTSNFSQDENFVVLECVNRLLEKGYQPAHLTLERRWQVGHGASGGKADINVFDREHKALIIIECKTWGREYEKYKQKMISDGGQLFSYLANDRNAKFLCLYASRIENDKVVYANSIVNIRDREETLRLLAEGDDIKTYQEAKTNGELYDVWKENFNCYFAPNGIFDEEVQAYNPEHIPIKRKDMKGFAEDEGRKFFSQFKEILRHNNISDHPNAFNKILSLILCKIVDERGDVNGITGFQIIEGKDTAETIQERLQNLYAEGMKVFLKEEIVNYSEQDIDEIVSRFPRQSAQIEIKKILRALKFYSNNEFAFKEVHNEKLFLENAKVLNEIITLLQLKKFRYNYSDIGDAKFQKQYLGNFFELLLDSGYKQNEGQYFTPIPIAKFIIQSLPVREIIERKLENGNVKFLPFVLDYACGSGHFLTEAIEEIQHTINEIDLTPKFREEINEEIQRIQIGTQWTGDYIFGIEKDYRLARTSKVAMFMHGDGEANILFGDGLEDHFEIEKKIVEGYDVIVANPPYAIHGFKPYIKNLSSKFSLFEFLTDNSSEIEVLFVERTKQLLRKDGLACIILPSSILTNKDALLYRKTRELIFQNFEIKAIVECGSETFLATTTNTVILFLSRRDDRWKYDFRCVAEDFILNNKKRLDDFADTNQMLKAYIEHIELEYDDYKTLLAREASEKLMKTQWFIDYQNWFIGLNETVTTKKSNAFLQLTSDAKKEKLEKLFYDKVLSVETEKFYYFLLTMNQQVLVIKTGTDKESQKIFLGYEKRSGKRDAGLAMNLEEGRHITKLYDELDKRNPEKANTYIYHQLLDKPIPVVCDELNNNIAYVPLSECLDFKNVEFSAHVNTSANSQIRFKSKHLLTALSDLTASYSGVTFDKTQQSFTQTSKIILTASNINLESGKITLDSLIYLNENVPLDSSFQLKKNDVFICTSSGSLSHLGKSAFINEDLDYYFGGFCGVLRGGDGLIQKFISIILSHSIEFKSFVSQFNGMNINNLRLTELMKFKIPVPPGKIIEKLLYEFGNLENEEENLIHEVYRLTHETQTLIVDLKGEKRKIRDYFSINDETVNPPKKFGEQYFTYIDIDCIGKGRGSIDFTKKIKGNHAPSRARRIAADKSVIISTVRPNLKGFAFLDSVPADCVFSTGFAVIKSRDENIYKAHLLYYIFQYDTDLMKQMVDAMPKSSYTSITQDDIYNFSIPDVGDSDQAIIVRKLTDIESRMSTLNEKLSKIPSKKENILEKYL